MSFRTIWFCFVEEEKTEVGRFSKNFLPILFNVHTQQPTPGDTDPSRLAVLDTIRAYLTVTDQKVNFSISYTLLRYFYILLSSRTCCLDNKGTFYSTDGVFIFRESAGKA